jgi:hypothetical protein
MPLDETVHRYVLWALRATAVGAAQRVDVLVAGQVLLVSVAQGDGVTDVVVACVEVEWEVGLQD